MDNRYEFIKDYKNNDLLRKSFNQLSEKTFGLDFEDWYQNGYWGKNYIPYSFIHNNQIVANVSVNIMDFMLDCKTKHFIQLGTVMTEEKYRDQGLIRRLMGKIENDYHKVDGFFLFANDSVLNFYPKLGYKKAIEFQYKKNVKIQEKKSAVQVSMEDKSNWKKIEEAVKHSIPNGRLTMINNMELIMFYVTKFMQKNVYYSEKYDTYVIAEEKGNNLFIHNIYAREVVDLDKIIRTFGTDIKTVTLGFVPIKGDGYDIVEVDEEDTTLFVKGIPDFENYKAMFPTLSHA